MSKSFKKDLTGQRFGRLTVIGFVPREDKPHQSYWKCRCDCGNETIADTSRLKSGNTKSCGCLQRDNAKIQNKNLIKHGKHGIPLYWRWQGMKRRCYWQNCEDYKNYGGRGITVCDEWKDDFQAFYDWAMANGYRQGLSIDRIDVNGNYDPLNCRWTDAKTQARNVRRNIVVEYEGKEMCLIDAAQKSGVNYSALKERYHKGDRGERLFRPTRGNVIVEYEGEKMPISIAAEKAHIKDSTLRYRYQQGDRGERLFRPTEAKYRKHTD